MSPNRRNFSVDHGQSGGCQNVLKAAILMAGLPVFASVVPAQAAVLPTQPVFVNSSEVISP